MALVPKPATREYADRSVQIGGLAIREIQVRFSGPPLSPEQARPDSRVRPSPTPPTRPALEANRLTVPARALVTALVLLGTVARLLPLLDRDGRLLRQFPTEDGYLMLTIARNAALGLGFSTGAGTLPTNGTQPFATAVYSLLFRLVGGDRTPGVLLILVLQFAAAVAGAWLLYHLGLRVLGRDLRGRTAAALAAATWYATVLTVMHGMNCLETGLYALSLIGFALVFLGRAGDPLAPWSWRRALALGAALGIVLWVRLDAVFLVAAACSARALFGPGGRLAPTLANARVAVFMGAVAVVVISPWLLHNRAQFGSFMPVSGRSESLSGGAGSNLVTLPAALAEYVLVVLPIPQGLERHPAVLAGGSLLLLGLLAFVVTRARRWPEPTRALAILVTLFALGLVGYYGVHFGAPWFVSRYMFALSPFLALVWGAAVAVVFLRSRPGVAAVAAVALAAVVAYPNVRLYRKGHDHMHFQVVDWVQAHVGEQEWVAAVQTGTVGFFHDRTINLDGKVNPEALAAVLEGRIPQYVLSKPVRYLADWVGIADWAKLPELAPHFELLVEDHEHNLAVLRRTDP